MKKLLFILLLTIPFVGFGQDLENSIWKLIDDDGYGYIILFNDDGSFIGFTDIYGTPDSYQNSISSEIKHEWTLKGNKIVLMFSDKYMTKNGEIKGNIMTGTSINIRGVENKWVGERIN